jgi:hypothetical protein
MARHHSRGGIIILIIELIVEAAAVAVTSDCIKKIVGARMLDISVSNYL